MSDGKIRFVGASAQNNGITAMIGNDAYVHPGNTITISYNGSVGETFYQEEPFWASDDVNILYPKFSMKREIALFLIPIIKNAGGKYAFIDKWKMNDMKYDTVILPADKNGNPDFMYMETHIKDFLDCASDRLRLLQNAV